MKKQKQLSFIKSVPKEFGGSLLFGKRKAKRPLSTQAPIHLVLKTEKAKGKLAFVSHKSQIEKAISIVSKKYGIKVYEKAINFNHIHMVLRLKTLNSYNSYNSWIRVLTSEIVKILSKRTKENLKEFFTHRPYTKIIAWGRQFKRVLDYQILNQLEVVGLCPIKKSCSTGKLRVRGEN